MPIQTPIRGLRSFCIAAKCLSFKHAASQLFLTPSAVSHQIKQLEEQLGISLFERQTRAIALTSAGKSFYKSVQPIITELEATIVEYTNLKQNKSITICLPEFFASELLVPMLNNWTKEYPDIDLQLETVKSALAEPKPADLSIVLASSPPQGGLSQQLFPLRYVPACNKRLYKQWKSKGVEALQEVPLILHQSRPWAWHQWADQYDIYDFDPKQVIQLDSMFSVARAAQQGMGIALVPLPISKSWFSEQLLVRLFDKELATKDQYYLVQHESVDSAPELALFADWLVTSVADIY